MSEVENTPENDAVLPAPEAESVGVTDDKPKRGRGRQKAAEKPSRIFVPEALVDAVEAECARQFEKWGEQNHPVHGGKKPKAGVDEWYARSLAWKRNNDARVEAGTLGWDSILLEEVYEALAEVDSGAIEEEIVQVIAVCVSMLDSMKRQAAA